MNGEKGTQVKDKWPNKQRGWNIKNSNHTGTCLDETEHTRDYMN